MTILKIVTLIKLWEYCGDQLLFKIFIKAKAPDKSGAVCERCCWLFARAWIFFCLHDFPDEASEDVHAGNWNQFLERNPHTALHPHLAVGLAINAVGVDGEDGPV